jgi:co-chaperonin GroES (HSP10)
MNIKPFEDYITVRPLEVKEGPKPRIVLSQKAKEQAGMFDLLIGEVVAVGPGRMLECGTRRPMDVKPGDKIMLPSRGIPMFPLSETAIWQANGQMLPPLVVVNVGHMLGVIDPGDIELEYAAKSPTLSDD